MDVDRHALDSFIVRAKKVTYVGSGQKLLPYRLGSHDLQVIEGEWAYHDSYFGGADFVGEEVVYFQGKPVWAMNYFGRIIRPELITPAEAGAMIKKSLTRMYEEGRFLGGFTYVDDSLTYMDESRGDVTWFQGREEISRNGVLAYELLYNGGLIKE